ncbi:MAG TPA: c-type cytochrome [Vicinamibacteria bacterium]|nr:c-type cytochrome [Vicinamibacteria bacterium]
MARRSAWTVLAVGASVLAARAGVSWWRAKDVGPVQRGWSVAEARGCFGCHGPGGVTGRPDPGGGVGGVPAFSRDELEAYARNDEEIREWILDGMPRRLRAEAEPSEPGEGPLAPMPAWRDVLAPGEVDDLVAYIKAVGDVDRPADEEAEGGREAAERLGCFGCHGPQGRGSLPNPRSLKGYIPAWDGPDFEDLARGDEEIAEWILDGRPRRLQADPLARYFLDRQVIQMPAYRGRITTEEVQGIARYIRWLRQERPERPIPGAEP